MLQAFCLINKGENIMTGEFNGEGVVRSMFDLGKMLAKMQEVILLVKGCSEEYAAGYNEGFAAVFAVVCAEEEYSEECQEYSEEYAEGNAHGVAVGLKLKDSFETDTRRQVVEHMQGLVADIVRMMKEEIEAMVRAMTPIERMDKDMEEATLAKVAEIQDALDEIEAIQDALDKIEAIKAAAIKAAVVAAVEPSGIDNKYTTQHINAPSQCDGMGR